METQNKMHNFGSHLMLDGYGGSFDKLKDKAFICSVLEELPAKIQMRKISAPFILEVEKQSEKDWGGISAFIIIAESHFSIHTFPDRRFITVDVYSCKTEMDQDFVVNYLVEKFELNPNVEVNYVLRGKSFQERAILRENLKP